MHQTCFDTGGNTMTNADSTESPSRSVTSQSPSMMMSPLGLMNFIHGPAASPYFVARHAGTPQAATPGPKRTGDKNQRVFLSPRSFDQNSTWIHDTSTGLEDWTLKQGLRLEFVTKGSSSHHSAWQKLLEGDCSHYWQHPAVPLTPCQLQALGAPTTGSPSMAPLAAAPKTKSRRPSWKSRLDTHHDNNFWTTRRQQWQECFRDIYLKWMQAVAACPPDDDEARRRIYFYVLSPGQTVLFRSRREPAPGDDDDYGSQVIPEILLSSSTAAMRQQLRQTGVQLTLLESLHGHDVFQESWLTQGLVPDDRSRHADSPQVQAELAALRQSQVFGLNVGADVSVAARSSSLRPTEQSTIMAPLVVAGHDDCAAFSEVYANTHGWSNVGTDVPRMVAPRQLGPFWHATSSRWLVRQPSRAAATDDARVEIRGTILPSAWADLLCAVRQNALTSSTSASLSMQLIPSRESSATRIPTSMGSLSSLRFNGGARLPEENDDGNCRYGESVTKITWNSNQPAAVHFTVQNIGSI
jgi:hypothetical protein